MKALLISFTVGLIVGIVYGVIRVKSPAPPIVALLGLLGMVLGEQAGGLVTKKIQSTDAVSAHIGGSAKISSIRTWNLHGELESPVTHFLRAVGLGIINQAVAARELIEHGAPASLVPFLMLSARTLEVVAGLCLAFGIYPRLAAVALLVFLVPATFVAHQFWQVTGTASFTVQLLNFCKNTAMTGGLLFIAATQFQPTLFPSTSRSKSRERTIKEIASRDSAPAVS